jgi:hypothetical protein
VARVRVFALLFAFAAAAPFQCARGPGQGPRIEDDPAEVLYQLSTQFAGRGDSRGRAEVLRYLRERYPSSPFARRADEDLKALGQP